jgi:hypothetical protein
MELIPCIGVGGPAGPGAGRVPKLVVIATPHAARAERLARELREHGMVVYVTRTADGCLRVATAVGPDAVLLDPALPPRLEGLLRAHPISAAALIAWLPAPGDESRRPSTARPIRPSARRPPGPLPAAVTPGQPLLAARLGQGFWRVRRVAALSLGRRARWVAVVAGGLLVRRSSR